MWSMAYTLIYSNAAVKGLTDIYAQFPACPRESTDISVKPWARSCYNIYVTHKVMYSIACNYLGITTLLPYWFHVPEAEEKIQAMMLQALVLVHVGSQFNCTHNG